MNVKNDNGQSPLHYACSKGRVDCVELLLENDADLDLVDSLGQTVLHRASSKGNLSIMKLLLKHKPSLLDKVDRVGNTSLHLACEEGLGDIATFLIQTGARYDIANKEKKTPLMECDKKLASYLEKIINLE